LAGSFVLTGTIIFLVNGRKAAIDSIDVMTIAEATESPFLARKLSLFKGSYSISAALGGVSLVFLAFMAYVRIRQKIAKERKYRGELS
jgi:hypothetical protein